MKIPKPIAFFSPGIQFSDLDRDTRIPIRPVSYFRANGMSLLSHDNVIRLTLKEVVASTAHVIVAEFETTKNTFLLIEGKERITAAFYVLGDPVVCSTPGDKGVLLPFHCNVISLQRMRLVLTLRKGRKYKILLLKINQAAVSDWIPDREFHWDSENHPMALLSDVHQIVHQRIAGILDDIFRERDRMLPDLAIEAGIVRALSGFRSHWIIDTDLLTPGRPLIKAVICRQFLLQHLREDLDLPAVAAHVGLTVSGLEAIFSKVHGQSLDSFLIRERIFRAKALLRHTSDSFEEIAYSLGFRSAEELANEFVKHSSLTPAAYRAEYVQFSEQSSAGEISFNWFD